MRLREETDVKDTWALEDIFPSDQAWKEAVEAVRERLPEYGRYRGRLAESAETLWECLKLDDELGEILEKIGCYASQKSDQDTSVGLYQEMAGQAEDLYSQTAEASSFIRVEITGMGEEKIRSFMEEWEPLKLYERIFFLIFRQKAHTLSDQEEALLAASQFMADGGANAFRMFNNADLTFAPVIDGDGRELPLTHGTYIAYMQSKDRNVRRQAYEHMYDAYRAFENTLAAMFTANVKQHVFYSRVRKYPSSMAYGLSGSAVPVSVYSTLIETTHQFLPAMYRYVKLRREMLGLDHLHMYDVYVPLTEAGAERYTFEEAKEIVARALAPMGEEYLTILRQGFENRWIDVYENKGKRSGAYSSGPYGVHPYVLLNFNGTLDDIFTLAHEMGHAIHSYYSDHAQPYCYAGYHIFVAEVASTCNEALVTHYLLEHAGSEAEKAHIINHYLDGFKSTMYRQTMFAEFEKMTHEMVERGEGLTAEKLCGIYHQLNELYFGEEMELDSYIDMEWARIPHFYTPFYVYQYATGYGAATAISRKILNGEEGIIEKYRQFLKGGNSMDCIDLLKLCGVDMTEPQPVADALTVFGEYLDQMENITKIRKKVTEN